MSFTAVQNGKTPFQPIKTRSSKSRKIDIFAKGLTPGFGQKMAVFPAFIFQAILARKMSFTIFQKKKTPFQAIITRSSKSRKIDIFSKGLTHGFGFKKAPFPIFFLGNIGQENVFYDILERKNAFLGYKARSSKGRKIDIFSNGLTHGFGLKMAVFPAFIFQAIQARKNFFFDILDQKTPQQVIKTRSSKSRKIDIFPKGITQGFGLKMAVFPSFIFQAIQARKMSFTIFYIGKTLLQPIKQKVQKVEKSIFFQRG